MNDWARKHDESSMELSQRMGHRYVYHRFFEGYTELPQMAVLPMLVWYLIAYGCYLPLRERIEIPAWHRSSLALRRASMIAAVCAFIAAVTGLLAVGRDGEVPVADGLLAALCFTFCGTALLAVNRLEAHIVYEQVDNKTKKPLGGVDIDG